MSFLVIVAIILPIVCLILGFSIGFAVAAPRGGKNHGLPTLLPPGRRSGSACLEEIHVEIGYQPEEIQMAPAAQSKSHQLSRNHGDSEVDVAPPPPGLPPLRTPSKHRSADINDPLSASFAAAAQEALGFGASPFASSSRPRSPTAHLMGHLVRCASQAMEQYESRTVLQRLTSADAATPMLPSSPHFLLTPMPSGLLSPGPPGKSLSWGSADEIHMDEVDLISKLGGGAFGSVYRGQWHGAPVAIKYIRTRTDRADSLGAAIREVMLSKKLSHPNVVQTFSWTVLTQPESDTTTNGGGGGGSGHSSKGNRNGGAQAPETEVVSTLGSCKSRFGLEIERAGSAKGESSGILHRRVSTGGEPSYSIPALWNPRANSQQQLQQQAQQEDEEAEPCTPIAAHVGIQQVSAGSGKSTGGSSRGVKRRRTGEVGTSPPSAALDLRVDSFNSEEGFGSPVKRKHGGVQSIFNLEGLQLTSTEALLVVVMEHCDLGSLQRAIQRRAFLPSAKWPQHVTFRALLRTAAEIAKGMEYLHTQHGIIHGDLKPENVLLSTRRADRRGYIAKVADFGLSRHIEEAIQPSRTTTGTGISAFSSQSSLESSSSAGVGGTTAYLPPEAFDDPTSRGCPADVYAFGIMLWQMYYCSTPYEGLLEAQVCAGVVGGWLRPEFTEECPSAYRSLAERCWAQNAGERPLFSDIWRELVRIEMEFRSQRHRSRSGSGNSVRPTSAAGGDS